MNRFKTFTKFINHIIRTLSLIRKNYLKLGKRKVISTYFKICLRYLFAEIIFFRKIEKITIFNNEIKTPNFRLFITLFETVFIFDEYYFRTNKKRPLIIDCGANIGISVLYFKLLYPNSKIIAIEPHPNIFDTLKKNRKANNWMGVKTVNSALSDKAGKITFYYDLKELGSLTASTIQSRVQNNRKSVATKAIKLSNILKCYKTVDFLKMDIEENEENVITEIYKSGEIRKIQQAVIEYHHHIDPKQYIFSKLLNTLEKAKMNYLISTYRAYSPFIKGQYQDLLVYTYRD